MQQMTEKLIGGFSNPNFSSKYQFDILGGWIFTLVALGPFSSYSTQLGWSQLATGGKDSARYTAGWQGYCRPPAHPVISRNLSSDTFKHRHTWQQRVCKIVRCRKRNCADWFREIFIMFSWCKNLSQHSFLLSGWFPFLEEIYNTVLYRRRRQDQESINPRLAAWARIRYSYCIQARAALYRFSVALQKWKFDSSKQIVLPVGA